MQYVIYYLPIPAFLLLLIYKYSFCLSYTNGDVYTGDWANGERLDGMGEMTYPNSGILFIQTPHSREGEAAFEIL